jgi:hypothetical protein
VGRVNFAAERESQAVGRGCAGNSEALASADEGAALLAYPTVKASAHIARTNKPDWVPGADA